MSTELSRSNRGNEIRPGQEIGIEQDNGLRLVRVIVDGTKPKIPEYLHEQSLEHLWWYYENASLIRKKEDGWRTNDGPIKVDEIALYRLSEDPNFVDYLLSLVKHGPLVKHHFDGYHEYSFGFTNQNFLKSVSLTSDVLYEDDKGLDIKIEIPIKYDQFDYWGYRLEKGLLVVRNSIEKISQVRGGTVYVDGNVGYIDEYEGVVYVNGNISCLLNVQEEAVLVSPGKVGQWKMEKGYHGSSSKRRRIPSPFIFTPDDLYVTMEGSRVVGGSMWSAEARDYFHTDQDFKVVPATPKEVLVDWIPEETSCQAFELCKKRTIQALESLISSTREAEGLESLVNFWQQFFFGRVIGFAKGRWDALTENSSD